MKNFLVGLYRFLLFFAIVAFVITCNVTLFLEFLRRDTGIVYTNENIRFAAIFTFYNSVFLGAVFSLVDFIRRKILVDRPIRKIQEFTQKIIHGDFSARLKPMRITQYNTTVKDLNEMAQELSNVETLKTDFVSNVSHELKTPLSVLQNYATLLEEPESPEEKRLEYAKEINRCTKHLSELVTNILKLNKLESQNLSPKFEQVNISEMLCECLIGYESEWEKKSLEINCDIEDDVYLNTSPELLLIVFSNLFSNALKFTPNGGKISVNLERNDKNVTVSVSDTGCGIDKETMKHIFDKFYQGDTSHSMHGNGLGLALVKRVVDILGGEIAVESTPDIGSTFTVKLNNTIN